MMAELVKVFVYGTLKRGFPNHHLLGDPPHGVTKFLTTGYTKDKYPLVVATDAHIPMLLPVSGKGEHVEGEVYEVDQEALSALDALEGHPTWYKRTSCPIITTVEQANTTQMMCDLYFMNNHKKELLELSFLSTFTQEHCTKYYVQPALRSYGVNLREQSQDAQMQLGE